ncbi:MAG: response regulator [Bacteroidota bacterium]|jgi:CheY-like chemotaxis protein
MKKIAILCVDDEKIILDSLKIQLENNFRNKYLFEYAENGEEALEVVEYFLAENVDILVVISDYQMPGMKGDEFAKRLKSMLSGINIIMLTGEIPSDVKENLIEKNIILNAVAKPWDEVTLINMIKSLE